MSSCDSAAGLYVCATSACMVPCALDWALSLCSFTVISMAAHVFAKFLAPLGFPTITLFIAFGLISGPFGLAMVSTDRVVILSWINSFALGFIGFSAGGHFQLADMRAVLPNASVILLSNVIVMVPGAFALIYAFGGPFIPFFETITVQQRVAACLLYACLAVARSPSSAIALIAELNARGPFTSTVLAVTVIMDVVVVMLFSITLTVARSLDASASADGGSGVGPEGNPAVDLLVDFASEILLSGAAGAVLGILVPFIVGWAPSPPPAWTTPTLSLQSLRMLTVAAGLFVLRAVFIVVQRLALPAIGWALFYEEELSEQVTAFANGQWLNPLICTMVAGFITVNFTQAGHAFHALCDQVSGPVFLLFFTYTGVSMNVGVLLRNVPACLFVFTVRSVLMYASSTLGGTLASSPPAHTAAYWKTFLTQAGVTLGLANSAAAHFKWGEDFSAAIVAVSVLNQVVGPLFMKAAIRGVGEDHHDYAPHTGAENNEERVGQAAVPLLTKPRPRGALVVALPGDATAAVVMRRLGLRGWEVVSADPDMHAIGLHNRDAGLHNRAAATEDHEVLEALEALEAKAKEALRRLPRSVSEEVTKLQKEHAHPWGRLRKVMGAARAFGGDSRAIAKDALGGDGGGRRNGANGGVNSSGRKASDPRASLRRKSVLASPASEPEGGSGSSGASNGSRPPHASITDMLTAPAPGGLPEGLAADPDRHAKCLRLLWLWASMKAFNVVVCLLPTDAANLEVCELIGDLGPLIRTAQMKAVPPQVVVSLHDVDGEGSDAVELHTGSRAHQVRQELLSHLDPLPLVLPRKSVLSSLICEILHPEAHWTGALEEAIGADVASPEDEETAIVVPSASASPSSIPDEAALDAAMRGQYHRVTPAKRGATGGPQEHVLLL